MSQLTTNVKFIQKAALVHEGKVLLLKRSLDSTSRPGAWDLPGGNSEWPEVAQPAEHVHRQDIAREIQEETGLVVDAGQFTDENQVLFLTYFEPEIQRYSFGCGWAVKLPDNFDPGSIVVSDEHTEYAWATLTELDAYDFAEPVGTYVKTIAQKALQRK